MSLYLKHRPNDFENLIGQDPIKKTLLNSLKSGNISHAYLFSGPRGTGKTTCARLIAKALNCLDLREDGGPCQICESCDSITKGSFVDLVEIDAASNTGIDNVRELQSKIGFSPTNGKKKVYVLDEVHMLSKGAFNALLKTLEEPPEFVHFILVTTEFHKVLDTITSRCINFNFRNISEDDITKRLEHICKLEGLKYENQALGLISHQANGGMRDAISLLDKLRSEGELLTTEVSKNLGITTNLIVESLVQNIFAADKNKSLDIINDLTNKGYDLTTFLQEILENLRTKLHEAKDDLECNKILSIISNFIKAAENFRYSIIPQLPLEMACIESIILINNGLPVQKDIDGKIEPKVLVKETIQIKEIHKEEKKIEIQLPELTIANILGLKKDIESKLKDSEIRIAFRNSEIKDFKDDQLFIETSCERDSTDINSERGNREMFDAFASIFGKTNTRFLASNKNDVVKQVLESSEEKPKTLNDIATGLFDF